MRPPNPDAGNRVGYAKFDSNGAAAFYS